MSEKNYSSTATPGGNIATSGATTPSGTGFQFEDQIVDIVRRELQSQAGRFGFRPRRPRPWGYPLTHTNMNCTGRFSNSTSLGGVAGSRGVVTVRETVAMAGGSGLGFFYANFGANNQNGPGWQETNVGNAVTVEFAIYINGAWVFAASNGTVARTLANGESAWWTIPGIRINVGQAYEIAMRITCGTGERVWCHLPSEANGDLSQFVNPATVRTYISQGDGDAVPAISSWSPVLSANTQSSSLAWVFPNVITVLDPDPEWDNAPLYVILGDSIANGLTASPSQANAIDAIAPGYLRQGLHALGLPSISSTVGGDRVDQMRLADRPKFRALVESMGVSHALIHAGTNDFSNGFNAGEVVKNTLLLVGDLKAAGVEQVFVATQPPRTGSTAAWTTVASQAGTQFQTGRVRRFRDILVSAADRPKEIDGVIDTWSALFETNGSGVGVYKAPALTYSGNTDTIGTTTTAVLDNATSPWSTVPNVGIPGWADGMVLESAGEYRLVNKTTVSSGKSTLRVSPAFTNAVGAAAAVVLHPTLTTDGIHVNFAGVKLCAQLISGAPGTFCPVVPVRSSAILPQALAGKKLEYLFVAAPANLTQATNGTSPVTANGQSVGRWLDTSGNSRTIQAGSDSARPTYIVDAYGTVDVVRFDGSDDHLRIQSGPTAVNRPLVMFAVMSIVVLGSGSRTFIDSSADISPARLNFGKGSSGNLVTGVAETSAEIPTASLGVIAQYVAEDGSTRIWRNGVELAADTAAPKTTGVAYNGICLAAFRTGVNGQHSQIDIARVEMYSGAVTETEILAHMRKLCDDHGIAWLGYR